MKVRQLVGRFAGQIVDMPYHVAQACLATGTAALPDKEVTNIRGMKIRAGIEAAEETRMVTADQYETKGDDDRPMKRRKFRPAK